jgi:hypothetical protein
MAVTIAITLRSHKPVLRLREAVVVSFAIAFLTSAPWFASFAMPDVFAGMLILGFALLASGTPLRPLERWAVVLVLAFAVTAHASHALLGLALLAAGASYAGFQWARSRVNGIKIMAWPGAAVVLGLCGTTFLSLISFTEVSLAPKRLPFALARSIEDGPARWHLENNCPQIGYTTCRFFKGSPTRASEFLFGPSGITRATAAEMEAIRNEEMIILQRAAQEYPFLQLWTFARNTAVQAVSIELKDINFAKQVRWNKVEESWELTDVNDRVGSKVWFDLLIHAGAVISILYLAVVGRNHAPLIGFAAFGLLANAAITGGISAVADRYQARTAWILPVLALALWLSRRFRSTVSAELANMTDVRLRS